MSKLSRVDIIVPTWNNIQYLLPMVSSVYTHKFYYPFRLIVVNNGHPESMLAVPTVPEIKIVQAGGNLGWEGGLKLGLQHADSDFVMFANDDIMIPTGSKTWLRNMMAYMGVPIIGAVGPTSNVVMGSQNIFMPVPEEFLYARFLIGFCMLLRREALEKAGGIDEGLPGGDDLDLSIRLRDAGYTLICDRNTFVYHHGFKTGERIHGTADKVNGWNSEQMSEKTNTALIRKHGFRKWYETLYFQSEAMVGDSSDTEGKIVRENVKGEKVLELGCGGQKTVPHAFGVDWYAKGEDIPTVRQRSVADFQADVTQLPDEIGIGAYDTIIARHILEHCIDPVEVVEHWKKFLKPEGGRLLIAVPNEGVTASIPSNPEHRHVFTPESLARLLKLVGFKVESGFTYGGSCVVVADTRSVPAFSLAPEVAGVA